MRPHAPRYPGRPNPRNFIRDQEVRKIKLFEEKKKKKVYSHSPQMFYFYNYPRAMSTLLVVHSVETYVYVLLDRPLLHLYLYQYALPQAPSSTLSLQYPSPLNSSFHFPFLRVTMASGSASQLSIGIRRDLGKFHNGSGNPFI